MIARRHFVSALAAAAAIPARAAEPAHFFLVSAFQLRQGEEVSRMNACLQTWLPAIPIRGPKLVLEAVIASHTPQLLSVIGVAKFEDIRTVQATLTKSLTDLGGGDAAFEILNTTILEAAAYSPEIIDKRAEKPRYFELRTYHAPSMTHLIALHQRFAGAETRVFHRAGIFPLFYTSTLLGANMPNLTYLIPFDSLGAREKAWDAFNADPEWIKARKDSIDKAGQIVSVSDIAIYRAAPYSPIS